MAIYCQAKMSPSDTYSTIISQVSSMSLSSPETNAPYQNFQEHHTLISRASTKISRSVPAIHSLPTYLLTLETVIGTSMQNYCGPCMVCDLPYS